MTINQIGRDFFVCFGYLNCFSLFRIGKLDQIYVEFVVIVRLVNFIIYFDNKKLTNRFIKQWQTRISCFRSTIPTKSIRWTSYSNIEYQSKWFAIEFRSGTKC